MATSMQDTGIPVGQAVPQATFTNWDGKSVELNGFTRTTAIFLYRFIVRIVLILSLAFRIL